MAKTHTHFVCQECGRTYPQQIGRCPSCGAWDSMVEEMMAPEPGKVSTKHSRGLSGRSTAAAHCGRGRQCGRAPAPVDQRVFARAGRRDRAGVDRPDRRRSRASASRP